MPYDKQKNIKTAESVDVIDWSNLLVEVDGKFLEKLYSRGLTQKQIAKFRTCLAMFLVDPLHVSLNNHILTKTRYRSFNVGGDLRVIYYLSSANIAVLHDIGRHSQLYA